MGVINKIKNDAVILTHALFHGLRNADAEMLTQTDGGDGDSIQIQQQMNGGGVLDDLLQNKQTQQVKELRDAYYRLLYESDRYKVKMSFDEDGNITDAVAMKAGDERWNKHSNVDESDGYPLRLIQENALIEKYSMGDFMIDPTKLNNPDDVSKISRNLNIINQNDYDRLLELKYDGFRPKIDIHKYVTRIVVKAIPEENNKGIIDLYMSEYPEQFNNIHERVVKQVTDLEAGKLHNPDFIDIQEIHFVTDGKAWNCSPGMEFALENVQFIGAHKWDGNFVLKFKGDWKINCVSVGEKFRTKELDEKYEKKALKHEGTIDLFTAQRHINDNKEIKAEN